MDWLTVLITALTSGGLAGFSTIWYARRRAKAETIQAEGQARSAESEATKNVQEIYQELIVDLKESRDEQKEANDKLQDKLHDMESRLSKLKEEVEKNARRLAWLIPMTCCVTNCKNRIVYNGSDEPSKPTKRGRKEN